MAVTTPLGVKRACPSCTNRFYDLNRRPANCPRCGHSYDPTVVLKPRRARRTAPADPRSDGDVLLQHMAKAKAAPVAKPKKEKEKAEMDEFEGMEAVGEELDDIEDLGELEEIEEADDEDAEEEIPEEDKVGVKLIDGVEEGEEDEDEEEETPAAKRATKKAPAKAPPAAAKKRGKK